MENWLWNQYSGDVNINIVLPDSAGRAGDTASYQRLADEDVTPEAEVDSIVMVMRPAKTPEVMLEIERRDEVESRILRLGRER